MKDEEIKSASAFGGSFSVTCHMCFRLYAHVTCIDVAIDFIANNEIDFFLPKEIKIFFYFLKQP
jgi:hypothetical protein